MKEKEFKNFYHDGYCPVRDVIAKLGDKWSILVLATLNANKRLRFSEVQKTIGDISQRMLTVTLRSLEADGLISREIYPEIPPRVEYELTDLGEQFLEHINPLIGWAVKNMNTIIQNRVNFKQ